MNAQIIDNIKNTAEDLGFISQKVKESSKLRKKRSEKAICLIDNSIEIGEGLENELKIVANANSEWRDMDNVILNTCMILKTNIINQLELINNIKNAEIIDPEIVEDCNKLIINLRKDLEEALENIKEITERDNSIVFMDKQLLIRKQYQQDSLKTLKEITTLSLRDADVAIEGSSACLDLGFKIADKFKKINKVVEDNNIDELNKLLEEANKSWNAAINVNKSSLTQYKFTDEVNKFTQKLYKDSISVKEMMSNKHQLFETNLQVITVLTVILSLKFKKYLKIEEYLNKIEINDDIRELLNEFVFNVKIACNDIRELSLMNYDMADISHLNNEVEDKLTKAIVKELECYDNIKNEVKAMSEATKYPIEGSTKIIDNGQNLETQLKKIIETL